jgi:hypothetical protein
MLSSAIKANNLSRRNFFQVAALTVGAIGAGSKATGQIKSALVALVADPNDPLARVVRALQELEAALTQKWITVQRARSVEEAANSDLYIIAAANDSPVIMKLRSQPGILFCKKPEANAFLAHEHKGAWLHPGLNADLTNQPYFVVRSD